MKREGEGKAREENEGERMKVEGEESGQMEWKRDTKEREKGKESREESDLTFQSTKLRLEQSS